MADKKPGIDKDLIRELAALLKETELSEIEIEQDDFRIRMSRQRAGAAGAGRSHAEPPRAAGRPPTASDAAPHELARRPGAPSGLRALADGRHRLPRRRSRGRSRSSRSATTVAAGQTILIVEAMKHMNEVAAPRAGKVVEILVEDGQPVEYGQPLMIIE